MTFSDRIKEGKDFRAFKAFCEYFEFTERWFNAFKDNLSEDYKLTSLSLSEVERGLGIIFSNIPYLMNELGYSFNPDKRKDKTQ